MIKPTKLQETELQELKDFQNQSESLIAQLGQLSFRKLQLEKEEQYLKQAFEQIVIAETKLSKKLKETYGDVRTFIDNLTPDQFEKFEDFFINMPILYKKLEFTCGSCEKMNTLLVDSITNFFV